mgnify:CR=1 FL=1
MRPYFKLNVSENFENEKLIVVDKFHPRWKEAAKILINDRSIETLMKWHVEWIGSWSDIPIHLDFDKEYGLTRIKLYDNAIPIKKLELIVIKEEYSSYSIKTLEELKVLSSAIEQYLAWIRNTLLGMNA